MLDGFMIKSFSRPWPLWALLLAGCGHGESLVSTTKLTARGWARPPETPDVPTLYCYRTLGEPVCYKEPLPSPIGADRFIASQHPPLTPKGVPAKAPLKPLDTGEPMVICP